MCGAGIPTKFQLWDIFQDSKSIIVIIDFENFPNNAFESQTAKFWFIVGLAAIFHSLQRKNSIFL